MFAILGNVEKQIRCSLSQEGTSWEKQEQRSRRNDNHNAKVFPSQTTSAKQEFIITFQAEGNKQQQQQQQIKLIKTQ